MTEFIRYIGIDYSGAKAPSESLRGLRVFEAITSSNPKEVLPPPSPRWYWSRREVAEWLKAGLSLTTPTLVGIDHAFSFPIAYFDKYKLNRHWDSFLDDFCLHWPTHEEHVYVDFVRDGRLGNANVRCGSTRWRRITEQRAGGAKSVFHFDVPGSVAKSTHAGIPWLRNLRHALGRRVHFWPFDGWDVPRETHVVAEVYPSLWRGRFPRENRTPDQQDAYTICRWLTEADRTGDLMTYFTPELTLDERETAEVEGWILGVA